MCKWGKECKHLAEMFASSETSDVRGQPHIRLDLSGDSECNVKWRCAVLKNLKVKESEIKNLLCMNVARHHWSLNQLKYFFQRQQKKDINPHAFE